jgi:hypothetical protein
MARRGGPGRTNQWCSSAMPIWLALPRPLVHAATSWAENAWLRSAKASRAGFSQTAQQGPRRGTAARPGHARPGSPGLADRPVEEPGQGDRSLALQPARLGECVGDAASIDGDHGDAPLILGGLAVPISEPHTRICPPLHTLAGTDLHGYHHPPTATMPPATFSPSAPMVVGALDRTDLDLLGVQGEGDLASALQCARGELIILKIPGGGLSGSLASPCHPHERGKGSCQTKTIRGSRRGARPSSGGSSTGR